MLFRSSYCMLLLTLILGGPATLGEQVPGADLPGGGNTTGEANVNNAATPSNGTPGSNQPSANNESSQRGAAVVDTKPKIELNENRIETSTPEIVKGAAQTGRLVKSGEAVQDNIPLQQSINAQAQQKMLLEKQISDDLKSGKITPNLAKKRREAFGLASEVGFLQGMLEGQQKQASESGGSSKPSRQNRRSSSEEPASNYSAPASGNPFAAGQAADVTIMGGASQRGSPVDASPMRDQLVDTSAPPTPNRADGAPVILSGGASGRIGENESRTNGAEPSSAESRDVGNTAASGGAVAGIGAGAVAPGTEGTPGAPAGLDKLDELLLKTAIQVKQRLNKQAKDGKGAGAATTDRGLASVQDGSATRSDAPYAGTAAEKPSAIGMADLFGAEAPAESGASLSAKRLARDLAAKLDETSEELVGSKLAVWFLLFFIGGFGAFLFIRRSAK